MFLILGSSLMNCLCRYGSYPLRGKYCHEMALRILLASIEVSSKKLLCFDTDFYNVIEIPYLSLSHGTRKNALVHLAYQSFLQSFNI